MQTNTVAIITNVAKKTSRTVKHRACVATRQSTVRENPNIQLMQSLTNSWEALFVDIP